MGYNKKKSTCEPDCDSAVGAFHLQAFHGQGASNPPRSLLVPICPVKNQCQSGGDELVKNKDDKYCNLTARYLFQNSSIIRRFHISPKRNFYNFYPLPPQKKCGKCVFFLERLKI